MTDKPCRRCGAPLPPEVKQQLFTAGPGRLEFHPLDMAQMIAATTYKVLPEDIVKFHTAARGSKRGLATGFEYLTGKLGHQGEGKYCGMECALAAEGLNPRPQRAPIAAEPGERGEFPGILTGPQFRQIRQRLRLSQYEFATVLGLGGIRQARKVAVRRFENGSRVIPPATARLAWSYGEHGIPKGVLK